MQTSTHHYGDTYGPCSPHSPKKAQTDAAITIAKQKLQVLFEMLLEDALQEILNPEVQIKTLPQLLIRCDRELGDVKEAYVLGESFKVQVELYDAIKKNVAGYYRCTEQGLFAQENRCL